MTLCVPCAPCLLPCSFSCGLVSSGDVDGVRTSAWANWGAYTLCVIPVASAYLGVSSCMFVISSIVPNAVSHASTARLKRRNTRHRTPETCDENRRNEDAHVNCCLRRSKEAQT